MIKKIILTVVLVILFGLWVYSQTVVYEYDNSGNRIKRTLVTLRRATVASCLEEPVVDLWGEEETERKIKIYPNPTKGNLKISITGGDAEDKYTYALYDSQGRIVLKEQTNLRETFIVPMGNQSPGIYILNLFCNKGNKSYKIIKQ